MHSDPPAHKVRNDLFRLLVESVREYAIFLLDPEGRVASWNAGAQRIKGYTEEEIVGRSFEVFYPPEDVAARKPAMKLRRALEDGAHEDEGYRVRKDGTRFWASVVITALFEEGTHVGFAKVTRDLSERRAVEEALRTSEERFRLLVDAAVDYEICMLDPIGTVVTWNAGAGRMKGYTAEEIVGQSFNLFYPPADVAAGKCELELEVAARDGRFEDEGIRVRKDGSRFWANVVITRLLNHRGELIGFAKVTRDLTERKKAEDERVRLAQSTEALRLRDEFLSIASHELRTPLSALKLQVQSLLVDPSSLDPKVVTRMERIERATRRLTSLIDALLDVSRIATGKLRIHPIESDLRHILLDLLKMHEARFAAAKSTVSLDVGDDPIVACIDPVRIEQAVSHLIDNALKYAAGASVDIRLTCEDSWAVLSVEDRGPGLPEDKRERIFDRFERAASADHYGGLGLGLYVTRQIVEAHGGTVAALARDGGGARFVVRLPTLSP